MTLLEELLQSPGFVYRIGTAHYFLGKWICKKVEDTEVTDCRAMYEICSSAKEDDGTELYFQKLRAYSDFAVVPPYDPASLRREMESLLLLLDETAQKDLQGQIRQFETDRERFQASFVG